MKISGFLLACSMVGGLCWWSYRGVLPWSWVCFAGALLLIAGLVRDLWVERESLWSVLALVPTVLFFGVLSLDAPLTVGAYDWHLYSISSWELYEKAQGRGLATVSEYRVLRGLLPWDVFGAFWPASMAVQFLGGIVSWLTAPMFSALLAWLGFAIAWSCWIQAWLPGYLRSGRWTLFWVSVHPIFLYLISAAAISQIWGMAFFFSALSLLRHARVKDLRWWVSWALAIFGLSLTYSHMLVVLGFLTPFALWPGFQPLQPIQLWKRIIKASAILWIGALAGHLILSWERLVAWYINTLAMRGAGAGPGMNSLHGEAWLGFYLDPLFNKAPLWIEIPTTIFFIYLLVRGWRRLGDEVRPLLTGILLAIFLIYLQLKVSGAQSVSYKTFKLTSFFLPVFLVVIIEDLSRSWSRSLRDKGFAVLVLVMAVYGSASWMTRLYYHRTTPDSRILSVANSPLPASDERVDLVKVKDLGDDDSNFQQMMASAALSNQRLGFSSPGGFATPSALSAQRVFWVDQPLPREFVRLDRASGERCLFVLERTGIFHRLLECDSLDFEGEVWSPVLENSWNVLFVSDKNQEDD